MYLEKTHAPQNAKPERNTHLHLSMNLDNICIWSGNHIPPK